MYQSRTPYLISLFLLMLTTSVSSGAVDVENVTFGFNGGYKTGKWAPVDVTVQRQHEPFIGELVIEVRNFFSDALIQRYATPLKLGATEQQLKRFYIYCPKIATKLVIQVFCCSQGVAQQRPGQKPRLPGRLDAVKTDGAGNKTAAGDRHSPYGIVNATEMSPPTPIQLKDYFVLALAPSGDKLKQFLDKQQVGEDAQAHVRYLPNSRALPTQWIGYDAVDILVIREVALTARNVTKAQQTALLDWVQHGGTLVVSGGSNFRYLQGSFIEPFLPVQLIGVETAETSQTGRRALPVATPPGRHERIVFKPKNGCQVVLGTDEDISIAKRNFGEGQILCFAFDYDALFNARGMARDTGGRTSYGMQNEKRPFTVVRGPVPRNLSAEQETGETFWRRLLETHGKSARHLADRYAPHRSHEEKIAAQFLKKMPTQVPLIKLLAIAFPVYLFSFGGVLFIFKQRARRKKPPRPRRARASGGRPPRSYWIGGALLVLVSISALGIARTVLPNRIAADRVGIVSLYPERNRAHLQRYVALRAAAREETLMNLPQSTFIRPLEPVERAAGSGLGTALQGTAFQVRAAVVEPWHPRTYVEEVFFSWDKASIDSAHLTRVDTTRKRVPPDEGLDGPRKAFAQILQREGVLQYLLNSENAMQIGWTSRPVRNTAEVQQATDETLVIMFASKRPTAP